MTFAVFGDQAKLFEGQFNTANTPAPPLEFMRAAMIAGIVGYTIALIFGFYVRRFFPSPELAISAAE